MTGHAAFGDRPLRRGVKRYKVRRGGVNVGVYVGKPPTSEGLLAHSSRLMVERARLEAELKTLREKLSHLQRESEESRTAHDGAGLPPGGPGGAGWRLAHHLLARYLVYHIPGRHLVHHPLGRYLAYLLGALLIAAGAATLVARPAAALLATAGSPSGLLVPLSWMLLIVGFLVLSLSYLLDLTSRQG